MSKVPLLRGIDRALLWRLWPAAVLLSAVALLSVSSIDQADWVRNDNSLQKAITMGMTLGAILALSRFSGASARSYSLFLSIAAMTQIVGRIIPPLKQIYTPTGPGYNQAFESLVWLMHTRILVFAGRVGGWISTLSAGNKNMDTGLFVLVFGFIAWNLGAWLSWAVLRRSSALAGALPFGFMLAVNIHLSGQKHLTLVIYYFLVLLLMAYTASQQQTRDWDTRQVDYPEDRTPWSFYAIALALVLAVVVQFLPFLTTPKGWQDVSDILRTTRVQTANTAEHLFSGVTEPKVQGVPGVSTPSLDRIGDAISDSPETVMWVAVSDPPPILPRQAGVQQNSGPGIRHYWRSDIYTTYTGSGWRPVGLTAVGQPDDTPLPPLGIGRYTLRQSYQIAGEHSDTLFGVNLPVQSKPDDLFRRTNDNSILLRGDVTSYVVISWSTRVTGNELAVAGTEYPAAVLDTYLQVPATLPSRVRDLAQRLTDGAATPFEKALRIQETLRSYEYTLDVAPPPEGRDVVDYFIFDAQKGFCTYYATSMAVMLRTQGVPARVVSGYAMGEYDAGRAAYRVPASASHAWVEVYFPGYGWVEFEPTPSQATFNYPYGAALPAARVEDTPKDQGRISPALFTGLVISGFVAALAGLFVLLRLLSGRRSGVPGAAMLALYRRMRRMLSWAGLKSPDSATADEFLAAQSSTLARWPALFDSVRQLTALYDQAAFSSHPPGEGKTALAASAWQRTLPDWVRLFLKKLFRKSSIS